MYELLQQYLGSKPISYGFFSSGSPHGFSHESYLGNRRELSQSMDQIVQYAKPNQGYEQVTHKEQREKEKEGKYNSMRTMTISYIFSHDTFLTKNRPLTQFVGDAAEIKGIIEEAFVKTTGQELPKDVIIRLCTKEELMKIHSQFGTWDDGIQGFALNRKHLGNFSEIFIKKDFLDRTMLTIGHELGHVFTTPLPSAQEEEAKAFAFEFAWLKAVREHNIGNLAPCIRADFTPAENGIHNTAFSFVLSWLQKGLDALALYWDLAKKNIVMSLEEVLSTSLYKYTNAAQLIQLSAHSNPIPLQLRQSSDGA